MHNGIDLVGSNDDLLAILDGEVFFLTENDGTGCKTIVLKHYYNSKVLLVQYSHCASFNVEVGQIVMQGEKVATMGATGNVTAKHLHCSMYYVPHDWKWDYKTRDKYIINPNDILKLY